MVNAVSVGEVMAVAAFLVRNCALGLPKIPVPLDDFGPQLMVIVKNKIDTISRATIHQRSMVNMADSTGDERDSLFW